LRLREKAHMLESWIKGELASIQIEEKP